jgi:hypothetical protein
MEGVLIDRQAGRWAIHVIRGDSASLLIVISRINLIDNCDIQQKFNSLVEACPARPMQGHASRLFISKFMTGQQL